MNYSAKKISILTLPNKHSVWTNATPGSVFTLFYQYFFFSACFLFCTLIIFATHTHEFDQPFYSESTPINRAVNAEWLVVGAGPAGILAVGVLLDAGVLPSQIIWIDPEFQVGRLGKYYSPIPANSPTKVVMIFINSCSAFKDCHTPAMEQLKNLDPNYAPELGAIVEPLKDVTTMLRSKIFSLQDMVVSLNYADGWIVRTSKTMFKTNNVILATGSHPRTLDYLKDKQIPLDLAFNKDYLATQLSSDDTVAVVGDSHSSMIVMKNLTETNVGRIINFYKRKLTFATPENLAGGLLGVAAQWARETLIENIPAKLIRIKSSPEALALWTKICSRIIYCIGYEQNQLPLINGKTNVSYDSKTGTLLPHLFGIGIAFPQHYIPVASSADAVKPSIGLHQFAKFIQETLPLWMKKEIVSLRHLAGCEDLFTINEIAAVEE